MPIDNRENLDAYNKAIETTIKGLNPNAFLSLQSIPGVGQVMAAVIMAEIGDIHIFKSQESLAKYAGLVWHLSSKLMIHP